MDVQKEIGDHQFDMTPYVLEDTPDVLGAGNRITEEGYGFWWPPYGKTAILITPGTKFKEPWI